MIHQFQRPTRLAAALAAAGLLLLWLFHLHRKSFACDLPVVVQHFNAPPTEVSPVPSAATTAAPTARPTRLSKVGKVTVAANQLRAPVIHRALKSHLLHNEIHGYEQFIGENEVVSDLTENDPHHRPSGAYTKPAYLLSILVSELQKPADERLEWVFWFDGDTLIMNPSVPLEVFLPPKDDSRFNGTHMLIATNWDGLNSGAFALRVDPWSVSLLSAVLAYPIYQKSRLAKDRFRDQSAFQFLLTVADSPLAVGPMKNRDHWVEVPMRWFNSFPFNNAFYANGDWLFNHNMTGDMFENGTTQVLKDGHNGRIQPWKVMQGDMLVHFAGSRTVRDSWMGPWLDRAEALLPEWNNASKVDDLRDEVGKFWESQARKMADARARAEAKAKAEAEAKAKAEAKARGDKEAKEKQAKEAKEKAKSEAQEKKDEPPKEQPKEESKEELKAEAKQEVKQEDKHEAKDEAKQESKQEYPPEQPKEEGKEAPKEASKDEAKEEQQQKELSAKSSQEQAKSQDGGK